MNIHLRLLKFHIYFTDCKMKKRHSRIFDTTKSWERKHLRKKSLEMAGGKCEICGKQLDIHTMQIHHVIPISMGGQAYDMRNIQCLCNDCHRELHNNPILYAEQVKNKIKELQQE